MKKIFSFVAVALASAAMVADPAKTPTVGDVSANFDATSNVVLAVYFDEEVCNDVVFVGNHQGWQLEGATKAQELDGFDGWYIFEAPAEVEQTKDDGTTETVALQGKPVQLKKDGSFSWDFQTGDPDSWVSLGGQEAEISAGYDGEANLTWPSAGVYIYESKYFKNHNSPCVEAKSHEYHVTLYAPSCGGFKPAIIGDFNSWSEGVAMTEDMDDNGATIYTASFTDEEKHAFKFKEVNDTDWSNQIVLYNEEDDTSYDNPNITLGEVTDIKIDYSNGTWTLCTDAVDNIAADVVATKVIRDGQIVILKDGVEFNVLGAQVK
ncbi:MAG: hypothetical protein IJQ97_04060 [Paludibacteraceae bacterium]|nr:hypothetical protein [Paludibacteraceae bacterium]